MSDNLFKRIIKLSKRRSIRMGIPFFSLVIGASFGLKQFSSIRYNYSQNRVIEQEAEKQGIDMKKAGEIKLEDVYEKIKDIDVENWQNVRIQRPWDENDVN